MNRNVRSKNRKSRSPAREARRAASSLTSTEPAHATLAELTASIAPGVVHRVLHEHKWMAPSIALALRDRGRTSAVWRGSIARSLGALLRWWGWIEPLHLGRIEEQLLLAWLLDSAELNAVARVWAQRARLRPIASCPSATHPTGPAAPRASSAGSVLVPSMPTRGCSSPPGSGTTCPCRPASPRPSSAVSNSSGHCRRGCPSGSACAERTKSQSGPPCERPT